MKLYDLEMVVNNLKKLFGDVDIKFKGDHNVIINIDLTSNLSPEIPDTKIDHLDFSVRTCNTLRLANIKTIRDLVDVIYKEGSINYLYKHKNFGRKSLIDMIDFFKDKPWFDQNYLK